MKEKYTNAFIIGFMVAVVVWSVAQNTFGLFALIPLFIIYKIVNNSNKEKKWKTIFYVQGEIRIFQLKKLKKILIYATCVVVIYQTMKK